MNGNNNILGLIFFYILIIGAIMLPTIFSNRKKRNKQKALMDSLKKGDNIVTIGGIHGKILEISEETVEIQIDGKGSRMTISKSAIAYSKSVA